MSKLGGKVFSEDTDRDSVGGQVDSIVAGANVTVDNTDPVNPIVASTAAGSPTTTLGDLIKRGAAADERLPVGNALEVLRVNAGGTDLEFAAAAAGGNVTTKGDLEGFDTAAARIPVGTDGDVLTADSTAALGVSYQTPAAGGGGATGTNIISTTTLGSAAQTIGNAALSNLTEFDFELSVPDSSGALNVFCYLNGDTTDANYRAQSHLSKNSSSTATEADTARVGRIDSFNPTLFIGQVRLVGDHLQMFVRMYSHESATIDNSETNSMYYETVVTDATQVLFDVKASNTFPIGTRLIIRDPSKSAVAGVTSSSNSLPLASDFLMTGELAGSDGQTVDGTITADTVKLDFIYFPDTTTISEVSVRSATASGGGTLIVGLHPLTARLETTTQDFTASLTISTSASTQHTEVLSTAWVVPKGWYALVTWSGASLSNIIHRAATTGSGIGFGKFISGVAQIYNTTAQEAETKTIFLSKTDYDSSPDLTGVVFNNIALYVNSPTAGQLSISSRVPMVYLKVV